MNAAIRLGLTPMASGSAVSQMVAGAVVVLLAVDTAVLGFGSASGGAPANAEHACTGALRAINGLRNGSFDRHEFSRRMHRAGRAADSAASGDRRSRKTFAQLSFGIEQLQAVMIQTRTPAEMTAIGPSRDVDEFVAQCHDVIR
ncbi:MAG: hypothetical protein NVS3B21_32330 [Acidimicrobiales bacterium]